MLPDGSRVNPHDVEHVSCVESVLFKSRTHDLHIDHRFLVHDLNLWELVGCIPDVYDLAHVAGVRAV